MMQAHGEVAADGVNGEGLPRQPVAEDDLTPAIEEYHRIGERIEEFGQDG